MRRLLNFLSLFAFLAVGITCFSAIRPLPGFAYAFAPDTAGQKWLSATTYSGSLHIDLIQISAGMRPLWVGAIGFHTWRDYFTRIVFNNLRDLPGPNNRVSNVFSMSIPYWAVLLAATIILIARFAFPRRRRN